MLLNAAWMLQCYLDATWMQLGCNLDATWMQLGWEMRWMYSTDLCGRVHLIVTENLEEGRCETRLGAPGSFRCPVSALFYGHVESGGRSAGGEHIQRNRVARKGDHVQRRRQGIQQTRPDAFRPHALLRRSADEDDASAAAAFFLFVVEQLEEYKQDSLNHWFVSSAASKK